ncbi:SLC13 family permease [Methylobacterium sp. J-092]|uniref:SLC13 family permease n=1 Tax=Methylobacterium sp. J-092 TaxID=2836667 RepID=UPI001FBA6E10|nr:SLC13 family permease [Methylobacterium sp. J-092]MCJ2006760.1 anion permease [Methylobacterium sp. J-092]
MTALTEEKLPPPALFRYELRNRFDHRFVVAVLAAAGSALVWFGAGTLSVSGRIALIVFLLTGIGWTLTRLNDTTVALVATLALVLPGIVPQKQMFATFGDPLIWLLVAAFVVAAVLRETGVTTRVSLAVLGTAGSVRQLFYLLTFFIVATALVIPSTSGRAALLLPVFLALSEAVDDRRFRRALALLFPSVILLSAGGSLIGAGAHLVAAGYIANADGQPVSYLRWLELGMPLALLCSLFATEAVLRLFLSGDERRALPRVPAGASVAFGLREGYVAGIVLLTVALWATSTWHGISAPVAAIAAAVALTIPSLSGVSLKTALRAVEWELILFLAATLVLGRSLVSTGAAEWLATCLLASVKEDLLHGPMSVAAFVAVVSVLAHLVITSRTARVTVLVPTLVLPIAALGYDPAGLVLLCAMGTGFCQTLPVSAKAVALFGTLDEPTYDAGDLLRLSAVLAPVVTLLLLVFALWIWPVLGMPLAR